MRTYKLGDKIYKKFKNMCGIYGGEIKEYDDEVVCDFDDDYEKFLDFSGWMKKEILPKKEEIRNKFSAKYLFLGHPDVYAEFRITRNNGTIFTKATNYEGNEGISYYIEEQIEEIKPELSRERKDDLLIKAIEKWIDKFPIEKNGTDIELKFDSDYDTWIIEAKRQRDINEYDKLDEIIDKEIDIVCYDVEDIPYPDIEEVYGGWR